MAGLKRSIVTTTCSPPTPLAACGCLDAAHPICRPPRGRFVTEPGSLSGVRMVPATPCPHRAHWPCRCRSARGQRISNALRDLSGTSR